jgi:hypothetical protein
MIKAVTFMKNKFFLPLVAVLFAVAGALATPLAGQMAWYHVSPNSSAQDEITNTEKVCATGRSVQCLIGTEFAYNTSAAANIQNPAGLLKYNP